MTLVLAPTVRIADPRPVGSAAPCPLTRDDIHRQRDHTNGALGDLPRIMRRRSSFTLARLGRQSRHVTPEQPYNPHS
jgi:hypothetical protein